VCDKADQLVRSDICHHPAAQPHQEELQADWKLILKAEQHGVDPLHAYRYHPKRYLFDTGVMREMRESAVPSLRLLGKGDPAVRTALGGVIENQVAIELSRQGERLAGWKKSSAGAEIDFVVKDGDGVMPVECKATVRIKGTHLGGIRGYLRQYGLHTGVIVSLAPYERIAGGEGMIIYNVPLYCAHRIREVVAACSS